MVNTLTTMRTLSMVNLGLTVADIPALILEFLTLNSKPIMQVLLMPGLAFILGFAIIAVWFERKFLARAMLRVGPYYCGGRSGVLQVFADFIKLFLKEMIFPDSVDWFFFALMPVMLSTIPSLALVLIPFDANWVLWDIGGLSLPMFLAIMGIAPLMAIFAGWSSNNKYSFIGAWRVAYMYISGEIPIIICSAAVAIMAGSFNLVKIVEAQSNGWFFIPQFLGFIIFFLGVLIQAERTPFDIPVAEVELVFGWRTEFSGILFGFTMMAEYVMFQAWTLLFITLYLGGYGGPILFGNIVGSHIFWLLAKFVVLIVFIILLRTVFPRPKIEQMIKFGWNYLTPLALLNLFIVLGLKLWGIY
ncbi:MAG: NADH-quinone oxidoreductase subunit H [Candidatus Bathyarchaeota archaeon]|nr:NADH-quinone oxidoreductase subunit H [Candidatus Bathyarchaeota archaeon]